MLELPEYAVRDDTIHHLDLMTLCNALPSQSVDLILCDLPYGITACAWDSVIPLVPMWAEFKRVIKDGGVIALTASMRFAAQLISTNLDGYKYDWVWHKSVATNFLDVQRKPLKDHEHILIFHEGKPTYNAQMTPTKQRVIVRRKDHSKSEVYGNYAKDFEYDNRGQAYPRSVVYIPFDAARFDSSRSTTLHPTQKPVALFEYLIRTYTQPGELVFDPCVGSGTTAIAARQTGRRFICGDSSRKYVEVARERLAMPYTLPMMGMIGTEAKPAKALPTEIYKQVDLFAGAASQQQTESAPGEGVAEPS